MQVKTHNQILSNHTHEENAGGVSFNDLRGFIALLEQAGELKRISAEVDWDLELSHVAKLNEQNGGPALLFENVKDYEWPVFTSALATSQRLALALGLPKETSFTELAKAWVTKVKTRIPPKEVKSGPCKENILRGDEVNLFDFPAPRYYEGDGGRFIGTTHCIISKSPSSGWVNLGTHRMQILDEKSAGIWMIPGKHIQLHLNRLWKIAAI